MKKRAIALLRQVGVRKTSTVCRAGFPNLLQVREECPTNK